MTVQEIFDNPAIKEIEEKMLFLQTDADGRFWLSVQNCNKVNFDDIPLDDEEIFLFLSSGQRMTFNLWNNKRETFAAVRPQNITELCNAYALCMAPMIFYDRLADYLNYKREAELASPIFDDVLRETRGDVALS